jgi:hypothetical protein
MKTSTVLKIVVLSSIFCVLPVDSVPAQSLYAPNGTYLGELNRNQYDPNSISNPYGRYGSPYSPNSINNPYGTYGSPYSPQSPNNPYIAPRRPYRR